MRIDLNTVQMFNRESAMAETVKRAGGCAKCGGEVVRRDATASTRGVTRKAHESNDPVAVWFDASEPVSVPIAQSTPSQLPAGTHSANLPDSLLQVAQSFMPGGPVRGDYDCSDEELDALVSEWDDLCRLARDGSPDGFCDGLDYIEFEAGTCTPKEIHCKCSDEPVSSGGDPGTRFLGELFGHDWLHDFDEASGLHSNYDKDLCDNCDICDTTKEQFETAIALFCNYWCVHMESRCDGWVAAIDWSNCTFACDCSNEYCA